MFYIFYFLYFFFSVSKLNKREREREGWSLNVRVLEIQFKTPKFRGWNWNEIKNHRGSSPWNADHTHLKKYKRNFHQRYISLYRVTDTSICSNILSHPNSQPIMFLIYLIHFSNFIRMFRV